MDFLTIAAPILYFVSFGAIFALFTTVVVLVGWLLVGLGRAGARLLLGKGSSDKTSRRAREMARAAQSRAHGTVEGWY